MAAEIIARGSALLDVGSGLPPPRPGRLSALVQVRPSGARAARRRRLRPAGAAPRRDAGRGRSDSTVIGLPGCYPTATILTLAPLARAGLIGDLVVDAKSGVSGAGREPKPDLLFSEVNESVKAYGVFTHRHTAEMEQELQQQGERGAFGSREANPGVATVDFLPHLIPMTRGILASCHVRPTRPVTQAELDALYDEAYRDEPFVQVVADPPSTKHVFGSNLCRVWVGWIRAAAASWPWASSTTWSRAPPARRSRPSTSSSGCPRRQVSSSTRSLRSQPAAARAAARGGSTDRPTLIRRNRSDVPGSRSILDRGARGGRPTCRPCPASCRRSSSGGDARRLPGRRTGVAGIKPSGRPDLGVIATMRESAAAAAVFTRNQVVAAPIKLSRAHLNATEIGGGGRFGWADAIVATAGSANAATGIEGETDQAEVCRAPAALRTRAERTLALSTGVIGVRLPLTKVRDGTRAARPAARRDRRGPRGRRRGDHDHRHEDQAGHDDARAAGPGRQAGDRSRSRASPRAWA